MNHFYHLKLLKSVLLLFCLTVVFSVVKAQSYALRHYDTNDGLPSSEIYHALQDSKGYIWFATDNGVSKFNGYEFTNYDISDGLAQSTILEIFEDYKGRIWFISISATLSFFENGQIHPFEYNNILAEEIKKKPVPLKSSFYVDSLDKVYLGIEGAGIVTISATGDIKKPYKNKNKSIRSQLIELPNKKVLVSYYYGFNMDSILYVKKKVKIPLKLQDFPEYFIKHYFAIKYNEDRIIISSKHLIYDISNYIIIEKNKFPFNIHWLSKDYNNNIWVCGKDSGAWCFKNGVIKKTPDIKLLENYNISSVLLDNKGGYWFTTLHNGVFYLPSLNVSYFNTENDLVKNNVNTAFKYKDSLWIGYHSNLLTLKNNNKTKNIKLSEKSGVEVTKIFYDTINNEIVVGTSFYLHTIKEGQVSSFYDNHEKSSPNVAGYFNVNDVISDNKGGYWICGGNGFYHLKNGKTDFSSNLDKNFRLRINALFLDKENTLWLGTINGLWKYKNKYLQYLGRINNLFKYRVLDIVEFQNKMIIGTKGGGILVLHKDSIEHITKDNGLTSNTITSMTVSGEYIWAGTKNGLNRIKLKTENNPKLQIKKITKAHGLLTNEIRRVLAVDSSLFISTNNGLIKFNTNSIKKDTLEVPVYYKKILINNKKVLLKASYKLKHNENNLYIKFEGISFKNANNILYKYMMKGVDTAWTYTKNKELRFSFLPPGNYTLLINAMNADEIWNTVPIRMSFSISQPFWKTTVFIIFGIIIFLILIYFFFRTVLNEIRKKTALKNELNKFMNQALVNQMNPHFLFNALNSINNYILKNDKKEASKYLTKFSGLIRLILENSQKEYITIYEEIKANKLYLDIETSRLKNNIEYEFIVEKSVDQFATKVPSLLIQPFLENAVWHGIQPLDKKGVITVTISKKDLFLQIEVMDNGIGRKKSRKVNNNNKFKKQSLGIEISRKRMKILEQLYPKKANIEYRDLYNGNEAAGTLVIISIPFIKSMQKINLH